MKSDDELDMKINRDLWKNWRKNKNNHFSCEVDFVRFFFISNSKCFRYVKKLEDEIYNITFVQLSRFIFVICFTGFYILMVSPFSIVVLPIYFFFNDDTSNNDCVYGNDVLDKVSTKWN